MRQSFLRRAFGLGFWTLIIRISSTLFGVWLSNTVGAEGTGLFQLVSSVYMLAVTFSTSGVTIAVTRITSEQLAKNSPAGASRAFRLGLLLSIVLGTAASVTLFLAAPFAAEHWLCDTRAEIPLRIFSFGLPFLSSASVIRGFFLGRKRTFLAVNGDIAEQVITVAVTVPLVIRLLPYGLEAGCIAMVVGSVAGEILSCIYAALFCGIFRLKREGRAERGIGRHIIKITFPVAIGNNVRAFLTAIENVLTPSGLRKYGDSPTAALSQYGIVKGMAWPILMLPTVLLSPFSSLLVPEISAAASTGNTARVRSITHRCISSALIYAFFAAGILYTFADPLCELLFPNAPQSSYYVRVLCPLIPLLYLDQIVDSILKGLDQQVASMRYNMADAALRVTLVFFLVPRCGIAGWLFMLYAGTIFNAALSVMRLIKVSEVKLDWRCWIVKPLCFCVICGLLANMLFENAAAGAVMYVGMYSVFIYFSGCVEWLKKGEKIFSKKMQKK